MITNNDNPYSVATSPIVVRILMTAILITAALPLRGENLAQIFAEHNPASTQTVNHDVWTTLLGRYLDSNHPSGVSRFDYAGVTNADSRILDAYLESLESVRVKSLNKDEQMAYWLNFYNALTVRVILDHYPIESIKNISLPGSWRGPWKAELVTVEGRKLSLDDMEHRILRPIWKDPRIHYGVNCASIGCPNLAVRAYTPSELNAMLDQAAGEYINHERGVSSDGSRLTLSSIYTWFKKDFGNREQLYAHLLRYADTETAAKIRNSAGAPRYRYDWTLNSP